MSLFYVAAGINHFLNTGPYLAIMPPYLPWHPELVHISGVAEIVLGILLVPASTRHLAAWGIIILLVMVFPANVQMMINYLQEHNDKTWLTMARLPLQLLLILWAYFYTRKDQ